MSLNESGNLGKCGKIRELNLKSGKTWKSPGIFVWSGKFSSLSVFLIALFSEHMPCNFLGPSKTVWEKREKVR